MRIMSYSGLSTDSTVGLDAGFSPSELCEMQLLSEILTLCLENNDLLQYTQLHRSFCL